MRLVQANAPVRVDGDEELGDAAGRVGPADDAVDRERVEDLVRDDGAGLAPGAAGSSDERDVAEAEPREPAASAASRAGSTSTGR